MEKIVVDNDAKCKIAGATMHRLDANETTSPLLLWEKMQRTHTDDDDENDGNGKSFSIPLYISCAMQFSFS
jgi:hypothetical protein